MPKTPFRLPALVDLRVLHVFHLLPYSTKKHIRCFPNASVDGHSDSKIKKNKG